jgi:hypothetical protein
MTHQRPHGTELAALLHRASTSPRRTAGSAPSSRSCDGPDRPHGGSGGGWLGAPPCQQLVMFLWC